ncbi:MAG: hypothetical protein EPN64_04550 [Burkholderiaceae bacterium]|nr:MAG: hypothetical protein EPN64_04550 [Burkholderiaceae bacterium]
MKFNSQLTLIATLAAAVLTLSGCGTYQVKQDIKSTADSAEAAAKMQQDKVEQLTKSNGTTQDGSDDVSGPWLAAKSVPLARDVTLPPALRTDVKISAVSPQCMASSLSLETLASCITLATGIPVHVKPDALLPASMFATRDGGGAAAATPQTVSSRGGTAGSAAQGGGMAIGPVDIQLGKLLDLADAAWGVSHRLNDDGTIEIFRLETKVIRLKALAQKITNVVSTSAGFTDASKSTYSSTANDAMADLKETLLSMGTAAGSVVVNPDTQSVVVTDTVDAVNRMQKYIDSENKRLTRRVSLVVQELFVTNKDEGSDGVNWSILYDKLLGTANTVTSPTSVGNVNAGGVGFNVRGQGPFSGSSVLINTLNQMGMTVTERTFPLSTINGDTVTVGLPNLFDYVAQVSNTAVTSTTGTLSAPSITQKSDKYGAYLTVTPEAEDDGEVLAAINFEDRTGTLTPYTVEVGGSGTTVQQRNIQESTFSARTILRVGVTHLVGGLDEVSHNSTTARMDKGAPLILGGSDDANKSKRRIILLITAVSEDNI